MHRPAAPSLRRPMTSVFPVRRCGRTVEEKKNPRTGQSGTGAVGGPGYLEPVTAPTSAAPAVEVRRSTRRTRTVSAYRSGETIVVLVPARLTRAEERRWVTAMVDKVQRAEARRRPSDEVLLARAAALSARYLDGLAVPSSVRWAPNQHARWGSCTPADGSIRISARVRGLPAYVLDYVLLHELAHLLVAGHGPRFWAWVDRYELTERARGFLDGLAAATGRGGEDAGEAADAVGSDRLDATRA